MMRTPRVVLDTNVVLSALVFGGGESAKLRAAWQRGGFVPLMSTATAQELIRVLTYPKFRLAADEREELLADYLPYCKVVNVVHGASVVACRDLFDIPFLQLALAGKAFALISGDKDLLALAKTFPVPIIAPADFLARSIQDVCP